MLLQFDLPLFGLLVTTLVEQNIWIKWEVVINRISWGWFTLTLIPFCAGIEIQTCPIVPSRLFERAQWKHRSLLLLVLLIKCCYLHIYTPILDSQSFPSKKQCSRTVQQKQQVQLLAKWSSKEAGHLTLFFFTSQFCIHWISAKTDKWQISLDETATCDL